MENAKPKSRRLAGWLAIFLGSLGVHNFYLGNKKRGFLHIFLFCLIFIPIIFFYHIFRPINLGYDTTVYDFTAYVPDYSDLMVMISILCILIFIANIIWGIIEGVKLLRSTPKK